MYLTINRNLTMLLFLLLCFTVNGHASLPPQKLVVVVTDGWHDHNGQLFAFSYLQGKWQEDFRFPIVVGKNGLGWGIGRWTSPLPGEPIKKEGDGKAPAGLFDICQRLYGYAVAPPWPIPWPYTQLTANWVGVDDPASRYYNRVFDQSQVAVPDWNSCEEMCRSDDLYQWLLVVEHNTPNPIANAGSCIFLHCWNNADQPTAGCTAMAKSNLLELVRWLNSGKSNLLVQLPLTVYRRHQVDHQLPSLNLLDSEKK